MLAFRAGIHVFRCPTKDVVTGTGPPMTFADDIACLDPLPAASTVT
jgi:hypothetical protein